MNGIFSQKFHAYIDYPVAAGLIVMPIVFGFTGIAFWLSVATGVAAFILTALTNHETGLIKVLPYKLHLAVDAMVGVVFVIAAFTLGLTGLPMAYFLVLGLVVLAVVGLHRPEQAPAHPAE